MSDSTVEQLAQFGQSIWFDNISRSLIESGRLQELIALGVRGVTSNPTIFDNAISSSSDYDEKIRELHKGGKSTFEIYDDLTIRDIQDAADMFKPVYEKTNGLDGYVSLEINPELAYKTQETIEEGKRLHKKVDRPNLMLKVPATEDGFGAIEALLGEGINVNITLIFSLDQYIKTAQAYLGGLNRLLEKQGDISRVASVASVFISRIDTAADKMIDDAMAKQTDDATRRELESLKGKAAVANSHLIYSKHLELFSHESFGSLAEKRARVQRVLWGSTGTKDPAYSDIKYVTELIAKNTVNTVPDKTFEAFLDHGVVEEALTAGAEQSQGTVDALKGYGIDVDSICAKLLEDGAASFTKSFQSLLSTIERTASEMSV
ncbi:MAG: transaldolase [Deltaproteobacteria bacterium]|nr:transaldolase [Deltaproteobacteria bacterium]